MRGDLKLMLDPLPVCQMQCGFLLTLCTGLENNYVSAPDALLTAMRAAVPLPSNEWSEPVARIESIAVASVPTAVTACQSGLDA